MKNKKLIKEFFKYVSLNILGMMGLSFYILADTFFIAQGIGAGGLSALNLALPIYSFIQGVGLMIGMGGATRYIISKSKGSFTQSIYSGMIFALIFLCLGGFFSENLARILGANEEIFDNTRIYIQTILSFSPMFLLNNIMLAFVRNDSNPKLAMLAMLVGSLSNIVLDYFLVFPFQMGMFGAAFATGLAPIVSLSILSAHFIKRKNTFTLAKTKLQIKGIFDIFALGSSALITEFSSGIVIIVFNGLILNLSGNMGVAAYGVIANIALVIVAIFVGISQGIQPIISRCFGENNIESAKKTLIYGVWTAVVLAILIYLGSICFTKEMVSLFNRDNALELEVIATQGILIYFSSFVFMGANILVATYFSAIGKTKQGFIISFLRGFGVILPTALILSYMFSMNGVWLSMPVTEGIVFVVALCLWKK